MLAGCATSGRIAKPAIPPDLRTCFDRMVQRPAGSGDLTSGRVYELIKDLKRSELEKSLCGKRLLAWIDGLNGGKS